MAKNDKIKDDKQNQKAPQQIQDDGRVQQRRLRFVEEGVKTQYSGIFNIGFGAEEVVFIFGNPSVDPNVVRIESKIAVSLKTAKRIALSLGNLIRRYETTNGIIDISPPKGASEQTAAGEKTKLQ
jgi:Protein of unknown function (DUF3467).